MVRRELAAKKLAVLDDLKYFVPNIVRKIRRLTSRSTSRSRFA